MKKQLLLLMMMLMPLVVSAYDIAVKNADGVTIYYNYITDGKELEVTYQNQSYNSYNGPVIIPDKVTNMNVTRKVTAIGYAAFRGCTGLTSVYFPENVTSIREWAFSFCSGLTSITIPNSVITIGDYAFYGCSGLTFINIPNSVTSIGNNVYFCCSGLTSITIPNSVTSIGNEAFSSCSGLTSITIPNNVTSIGNKAFRNCSGLTSITIPNSVTSIGNEAFSDCSGLTSITIPNSVTSIGNEAFSGCSGLTSITIPDSVTSISNGSFNECTSLTSITIPSNVNAIGHSAFSGCTSLTSIAIPNSVTSIGEAAFMNCTSLTSITIPSRVTTISGFVFNGCHSLTSITIPSSVTCIGEWAFLGCRSLTSITIPIGVTSISDLAFYNCSSLTSITIPNSITSIGEAAFSGCSGLTQMTLPETLRIIRKQLFYNCKKLESIIIPATVEFIYQEAFANCDALESVKAKPGTPPFLYDNSFSNFSIPLEVPKGCKEEYQTAQGWKNFTNISESDKGYYKLIYIVDNKEYKSYKVEEGSSITPEPAPEKEGYTFSGWSEIPETMPAQDVTVTGTFSINKYKLTYIVDGEEYKNYEAEYNASITPEAEPTKEGHTFSGWSEIPETMPAHDVTVTGTFSINKYKLIYTVEGEEYKSYEVEYGTSITSEAEPTKEGYSFSGWSEIPETMPAHDVTVTGTFCINSYKLTYIIDGEEYKSYQMEYGANITPEAEPTKEGYSFCSWSEIPETMPAHDVTITGTFSINKYKLTYSVDGDKYKSYNVEYGATILPEAAPTKDGYTFSGWSGIPETMPAHDVTVTGTFCINKYKLIYTIDGNEYKSYNVEYGASITPEAEPTKEGYSFSGWSEVPQTMPAHDVTVTGSFTINKYKLTYTVDGEEYKSYEVEYGATIAPEAEPTNKDYTFSGWSEIPETMPAHDVTVTGTFSINKYKLIYTVDGEEYKSYEVEYGATITPEAVPAKEGYTFSGWSEIPETMPAHDVTITGSFSINKYKLTYTVDGEEYKSYKVEYGATITPEPAPTKEDYTFSGWSEIPETMPAHDVTITGSFTMSYPYGQCETPTISYANGKLKFECKTEGVEYVSTISDEDIKTHTSDEVILTATYLITVYAKAEGYKNSEVAAATLCWIDAEPWAEGTKEAEDNVTEVKALPVLIQANDGVLNISGTSEGANISVYDTSGRMLGSSTAINGKAKIAMPSINKNIIVKIGDKAVKVKIK